MGEKKNKKYSEKLSYKIPVLNERDIRLLKSINDFVCVRSIDVAILAGFGSISYVNKRLLQFERAGYLRSDYLLNEKIYTITGEGCKQIGEKGLNYDFNSQTRHYLYTVRVASIYFANYKEIKMESIIADRHIKRLLTMEKGVAFGKISKSEIIKKHRPDFILRQNAFEIELTFKKYSDLKNNMKSNAEQFEGQVWIYPEALPNLRNNIRKAKEELKLNNVAIISYERVNRELKNINLKLLADNYDNRTLLERWEPILPEVNNLEDKLRKYRGDDYAGN